MTLRPGLAVRLSALEREMILVERMAEGSWSGAAAERFHQEVAQQRRLVREVRDALLQVSTP